MRKEPTGQEYFKELSMEIGRQKHQTYQSGTAAQHGDAMHIIRHRTRIFPGDKENEPIIINTEQLANYHHDKGSEMFTFTITAIQIPPFSCE